MYRKWINLTILFIFLLVVGGGVLIARVDDNEVYYVRRSDVIGFGGVVREEVVRGMVDALICEVYGKDSRLEAYREMISSLGGDEVVGLKVSSQGGRMGGTRVEVVEAVVKGLRDAGLKREQIVVWDRRREDLVRCGFREDDMNYVLAWTEGRGGAGYDEEKFVMVHLLGKLAWGDRGFVESGEQALERVLLVKEQMSSRRHWSKILSRRVQKVVHIPSLQDHFGVGVNGAIVDMTISNMDNWRRFTGPPDFGDPYLAEVYGEEMVKGKVVLTILDGLYLQYAGGPFASPAESKEYGTIFASKDAVALDAVARGLLERERVHVGLPKLRKFTRWIESGEKMGLGLAEEGKVRLKEIEPIGVGE
ncbi:MAG: DUF362 domain-containing protein [Chthoniobacterales bacterium]|nr:DUF362 domain-containing protein [Chthoniobacterales bacterium]